MTVGQLRIDRVDYADRVLRYSGTMQTGQLLTDDFKAGSHRLLKEKYCANQVVRDAKVSVAYEFTAVGMRNLNDAVRAETWTTKVGPGDC